MKIEEIIAAVQAKLGVTVDGKAGPETWGAIYDRIVETGAGGAVLDTVDARSEKVISTLLPEVQPMARALVQKSAANGIKIKIISGLRTYEEQDKLYAQGRTAPGDIITKAKGGYSNHNFGIAFDDRRVRGRQVSARVAKVQSGRRPWHGTGLGVGRQLEDTGRPAAFSTAARLGNTYKRKADVGRTKESRGGRLARVCLRRSCRGTQRQYTHCQPLLCRLPRASGVEGSAGLAFET